MTRRNNRPTEGEARAERPTRSRVSGHRDILTVENRNPNYYYRWVLDKEEDGARVRRYVDGGYEFVTKENDNVAVGDVSIKTNQDLGTLLRVPAGPNSPGQYLYLMRILQEYREEDLFEEEKELRSREASMYRSNEKDGQYGEVRVDTHGR